jgi:hypothetical protein
MRDSASPVRRVCVRVTGELSDSAIDSGDGPSGRLCEEVSPGDIWNDAYS